MHRKRSFSAVLGVACLALMALVFTVVGPAAAKVNTHQAAKVTVVTVTAGKPSELAFKLSKFSALPAGPITFKVTNMGLGGHDFKICTTPVTSLAKNACLGKVTKLLKHGDLEIDLDRHTVRAGDRDISLTPIEFNILKLLASNPGYVYSRNDLLSVIWDTAYEGYKRNIDPHVNRLRTKLEENPKQPKYILTVWGIGYKFNENL